MKKLKKTPGGSRGFQEMRVCQSLGRSSKRANRFKATVLSFAIGIGTNFNLIDVASCNRIFRNTCGQSLSLNLQAVQKFGADKIEKNGGKSW